MKDPKRAKIKQLCNIQYYFSFIHQFHTSLCKGVSYLASPYILLEPHVFFVFFVRSSLLCFIASWSVHRSSSCPLLLTILAWPFKASVKTLFYDRMFLRNSSSLHLQNGHHLKGEIYFNFDVFTLMVTLPTSFHPLCPPSPLQIPAYLLCCSMYQLRYQELVYLVLSKYFYQRIFYYTFHQFISWWAHKYHLG